MGYKDRQSQKRGWGSWLEKKHINLQHNQDKCAFSFFYFIFLLTSSLLHMKERPLLFYKNINVKQEGF